jgi:hypothetical protein
MIAAIIGAMIGAKLGRRMGEQLGAAVEAEIARQVAWQCCEPQRSNSLQQPATMAAADYAGGDTRPDWSWVKTWDER